MQHAPDRMSPSFQRFVNGQQPAFITSKENSVSVADAPIRQKAGNNNGAGTSRYGRPPISKRHSDDFEFGETVTTRFQRARSPKPAETKVQSKAAIRLHRLWFR